MRIGEEAPNFKAQTTEGEIDFHQWIGDRWAVLFSSAVTPSPQFRCRTEPAHLPF